MDSVLDVTPMEWKIVPNANSMKFLKIKYAPNVPLEAPCWQMDNVKSVNKDARVVNMKRNRFIHTKQRRHVQDAQIVMPLIKANV